MNATHIQHPQSRRSWIVIGAIVALIAAVLLAFSVPWNLNSFRGWIAQKARTSTGRPLNLDGDLILYWGLFRSGGTHLTAENIRFGNPEWAKQPEMFKAARIDAEIALAPLFKGEVFLPHLILDQPDVQLEILADGRRNWALDTGQKNERDLSLKIASLTLNGGHIGYRAAHLQTDIQAEVKTDQTAGTGSRIVMTADGLWKGLKLNLGGQGDNVLRLRDTSVPYGFNLHAVVGQTKIDAQGSVTDLLEPVEANVKLKLSGATMDEWYKIANLGLPDSPPYRTEGQLSLKQGVWHYDGFTGQLGQSEIGGSVAFEPRDIRHSPRPLISGKIYSPNLDLKDLGPLIGKTRAAETPKNQVNQTSTHVLPQQQFSIEKWNTLDADLNFEAKQVRNLATLPFDNLNGHLVLQDRVLTLSPLRFGFANGELSNEIRLDGRTTPMQARIDGQFRNLQLYQLMPRLEDTKAALGNLNGKIVLNGQGNSIAAILGSGTGTIQLGMGRGEISNLSLELLDLDAYEALGFLIRGDRSVKIRCAIADLGMKDGLMTTRTFVFDTTDTIVNVQGQANFASENLDLKISPLPKDLSPLTLRVPFHIRGRFANPDIGPDKGMLSLRAGSAILLGLINPLAALIPLIETGPGKDSQCGELLNQLKNVPVRNVDTNGVDTNRNSPAASAKNKGANTKK